MKDKEKPRSKPDHLDQFGREMGGDKITEKDAPVTSNKEKRKWMK
ncbi:hypothetical protein [Metallumcola ferriviriculae]